jgi:phenylacetate-CoA ligase
LKNIEDNQWVNKKIEIINSPILTREDLRGIEMNKDFYTTKTSGSTGEPLTIGKTYFDYIWFIACNILEFRWRNWDVTKNVAVIKPGVNEAVLNGWGIPNNIEPKQGLMFVNGYKSISELQSWLEKTNPHYISCYPSIYKLLDTSKITNLIGWKGTGEVGGTIYSSEECGIIALECPDNKGVYHVMDNQFVETDSNNSLIITTLTNPYIKRYKHGDHVELGECNCGRKSQVITKIYGRVRNMFTLPNGDKKWPLIGSLEYYEKFGIKRFKAIQHTLNELELQLVCDPLGEKESDVKSLVIKMLESPINVTISYVEDFPNYKFEEFVSMV